MADGFDQNVDFLYKTMLHRDPKKRQVKLVERHLLQLDFAGLDDSSDDSDFEVPQDKDSGEETPEDEDEDDDEDGDKRSSKYEQSDSDDSDVISIDHESEKERGGGGGGEKLTSSEDGNSRELSIGELIERAKATTLINKKTPSEETGISSTSSKKLKVHICCVCLGDISEEDDEIVECDGCGVSVHEGCYGISESLSVASTESSASTEPWFCDACKAGVKPQCELCPNTGGIYKETDAGKWVHIVCALYVPGVAFGDVDKLSPVTLFEMSYTKWGARACCLCEDERYNRTGVCIDCDAGMCRSYFHVTCAQREGLLSEASPEEDIADPFYAYCKQHVDKNASKVKRRNWLAVQSNVKHQREGSGMDEKEKTRVQRKLNRHREKYAIAKEQRPPHWMPTEKMPRMLTSCPSAMKRLMKKAEMLGLNTQVQTSQKDIRKKWHVATALSVDFVSYYLDRNVRIKNMKSHFRDLIDQKEKLQEQERVLRIKYDQLSDSVSKFKRSSQQMRQEGEKIWRTLMAASPKKLTIPELIQPRKQGPVLAQRNENVPTSPPAFIHQCGLCHQTHDQHLLVKCDACKLYYHLGCLDPPLTRMPKKSKLFGWQCSECVSSSSDESEASVKVDPDAPRRLRETIKEPAKFSPFLQEKYLKAERKKTSSSKPKKKLSFGTKKRRSTGTLTEGNLPMEAPAKKPRVYNRPPRQPKDIRTECCSCNQPGCNDTLVRCDGCKLCYHLTCLDPPAAKTPKQRGYDWFCAACEDSDDSTSLGVQMEYKTENNGQDLPPLITKVESAEPEHTTPPRTTPPKITPQRTTPPKITPPKQKTNTNSTVSTEELKSKQPVAVKREVTETCIEKTQDAGREMTKGNHSAELLTMLTSPSVPKPPVTLMESDELKTPGKLFKSEEKTGLVGGGKGKVTPKSGKRITDIAAMLASKKSKAAAVEKTSPKAALTSKTSPNVMERSSPTEKKKNSPQDKGDKESRISK